MFEIQKAVLLPVFAGHFRDAEKTSPTTEVWQTLAHKANRAEAWAELKRFRDFNRDRKFHYRVVRVEEEPLDNK